MIDFWNTLACPMCRDSVAPAQAAGFNSSIGLLLGGAVVVCLLVVRQVRSIVRQSDAKFRSIARPTD